MHLVISWVAIARTLKVHVNKKLKRGGKKWINNPKEAGKDGQTESKQGDDRFNTNVSVI